MTYQDIAQDTLQIIKNNFYKFDGQKIILSNNPQKNREVYVCTPDIVSKNLQLILDDINGKENDGAAIKVDELDSYESAKINGIGKTLVLNFANAYTPGGGFLRGAIAQEESLCRRSTLYESLSSEAAQEMYSYNRNNVCAEGSDYMLLTPSVIVFRDERCQLLKEPFQTAVLSVAAPNLGGEAFQLDELALKRLFHRKIRNILSTAAVQGYETLILGAWGCGAFGNDAKNVASYFYDILISENFKKFFKKIVFSIVSKGSRYNLNSFRSIFC